MSATSQQPQLPDLFGNATPAAVVPDKTAARRAPLKVRVLDFFHGDRFQAFTAPEVCQKFPDDKIDSVNKTIARLIREGSIRATGEMRNGYPCLIKSSKR